MSAPLCVSAPLCEISLRGLVTLMIGVVTLGCGPSNPLGTAPVSGKVTYNGQPVQGAAISFVPIGDGRPATAITGADGSYSLTTVNWPGAMPGQYTVLVRKTDYVPASDQPVSMEEAVKLNARPPPPPKELLPAKYADATKSPLKVEIKKSQKNAIDLQLAD